VKREYIFYSDLHIGGPNEIRIPFLFTKNTVFLGDNFEIKNSLRSNLFNVKKLRAETKEKCLKKGGIYVSGNHSLQDKDLQFKRGKMLFLHGDLIHYGKDGSKKWRNKKEGKSKLYWHLLKYFKKIVPDDKRVNPLELKYLERVYKTAKKNYCETVIMGHFHKKKLIYIKYKGIRIIILPRGETRIAI
jgi:UDP-2,3-diacylglucosamine pyrophosphatase LpxH